jgi:hypothetical protein
MVLCCGCAGTDLGRYTVTSVGCERQLSCREKREKIIRKGKG